MRRMRRIADFPRMWQVVKCWTTESQTRTVPSESTVNEWIRTPSPENALARATMMFCGFMVSVLLLVCSLRIEKPSNPLPSLCCVFEKCGVEDFLKCLTAVQVAYGGQRHVGKFICRANVPQRVGWVFHGLWKKHVQKDR